uniref:Uncharacterized protein n=1 Tax=Trichuris muris TaxID=70415 RepID=A0A5S6QP32_TRIMR
MMKNSIVCCFIPNFGVPQRRRRSSLCELEELQGDDLNLVKTKSVISAFVSKLLFFRNNLARGEFYNFPNLSEICSTKTSWKGSKTYCPWKSQEELLDLQANEELKPRFKLGYVAFWLQRDIRRLYPGLWTTCRCGAANEEEK